MRADSGLANRRLQPLGHSSVGRNAYAFSVSASNVDGESGESGESNHLRGGLKSGHSGHTGQALAPLYQSRATVATNARFLEQTGIAARIRARVGGHKSGHSFPAVLTLAIGMALSGCAHGTHTFIDPNGSPIVERGR